MGILIMALTASACPKKAPPPMTDSSIPPAGSSSGLDSSGLGGKDLAPSEPGARTQERIAGGFDTSRNGPLPDVYFEYDSFELSSQAREVLQQNAGWLQRNPETRVEIEGHCDERGTVEYNLALGAKRAKAARDYLVALGVSANQISTISYGEELPVCREPNESCWQQNRRDHFLLIGR